MTIKNGQQMHVSFEESKNVIVSALTVTAPEDSPNTDGIHITNTQNIQILNTVIGTGILNLYVLRFKTIKMTKHLNFCKFLIQFSSGDDCISIESGSMNVQATKITCGPGHGIRYLQ